MGHEAEHAEKGIAGGYEAMVAGDDPDSSSGPAMKVGQATYREDPTLPRAEAERLVDEHIKKACSDPGTPCSR